MLKFAVINFTAAMLPGNILAPLNILFGTLCLLSTVLRIYRD